MIRHDLLRSFSRFGRHVDGRGLKKGLGISKYAHRYVSKEAFANNNFSVKLLGQVSTHAKRRRNFKRAWPQQIHPYRQFWFRSPEVSLMYRCNIMFGFSLCSDYNMIIYLMVFCYKRSPNTAHILCKCSPNRPKSTKTLIERCDKKLKLNI